MASEPATIEMEGRDAVLAGRLRRALRAPGDAPLRLTGELTAPLDDAEAAAAWIGLLCQSARPVMLHWDGPLGQRGIVALLASDVAIAGQQAGLSAGWRDTPGLAALAWRRGGPELARRLAFGPVAGVGDLVALGLAMRGQTAQTIPEGDAAGRKRSIRAAQELPFGEALAFGLCLIGQEQAE